MSWRSRGLPRELEQGGAPGPAPNPWTLALSLPLTQPSASLTCVLSNQVDQKTATLDLGDICGHGECILQRGGAPGAQAALGEGFRVCPLVYGTTCHLVTPSRVWQAHPLASALACCSRAPLPPPSPLLVQAAPSRDLCPPSSIIPCVQGGFHEGSRGMSGVCATSRGVNQRLPQDSGPGAPLLDPGLTDNITLPAGLRPRRHLLSSAPSLWSGSSLCPQPFQVRILTPPTPIQGPHGSSWIWALTPEYSPRPPLGTGRA